MNCRQIVYDALGLVGVLDPAETPSAEDYQLGLRTLDGLLKELPLYGYAWPNLVLNQAVTWSGGAPAAVALPADYSADLFVTRTDTNGKPVPLTPLTRAYWLAMTGRQDTGAYPTHFYEDVSAVYLWPVPTEDPGLKASYTAAPNDVSEGAAPDVPRAWHLGLSYGLAAHLAPFFARDPLPLLALWNERRARFLANGVSTAPVVFELED